MTTTIRTADATPALIASASLLLAFTAIACIFARHPLAAPTLGCLSLAFLALSLLLFADDCPYATPATPAAPAPEPIAVAAAEVQAVREAAVAFTLALPAVALVAAAPVPCLVACGTLALLYASLDGFARLTAALDRRLSGRLTGEIPQSQRTCRPSLAGLRSRYAAFRRPVFAS